MRNEFFNNLDIWLLAAIGSKRGWVNLAIVYLVVIDVLNKVISDIIIILDVVKVYSSFLVEKDISVIANHPLFFMFIQFDNLVIIEFVPIVLIFSQRGIMSSIQSSGVQDNSKKVINLIVHNLFVHVHLLWTFLVTVDHKVLHIQICNRVEDWRILLLVCHASFESFESDY